MGSKDDERRGERKMGKKLPHVAWLCCKDSREQIWEVSHFLLCLGNQPKQAGNERDLSRNVPFFHSRYLPLAKHMHTLVSL